MLKIIQQPNEVERPKKVLHMKGDKNSISKIYNDIRQSGYAPPVWKRAQVPGLKESRLTIRGDEDRGLVSSKVKSKL